MMIESKCSTLTQNGFSLSRFLFGLTCFVCSIPSIVIAFSPVSPQPTRITTPVVLLAATSKQKSSDSNAVAALAEEEEEKPAGVVGAEFFGGNKQKEELYDPEAEAEAGKDDELQIEDTFYKRFEDPAAFDDPTVGKIAASLQSQINAVLYEGSPAPTTDVIYSSNVNWETSLSVGGKQTAKTPLTALENALEFYKQVDVAVVAGTKRTDDTVQLQWEISLVWPIFWDARVVLTGSSTLTLGSNFSTIIKQVDDLSDAKDLLSIVTPQVTPRFWDFYHIGMTPSAEIMPRLNLKESVLPGGPSVFEIPARLVAVPTMLDVGDRDDGNAQTVPNHAFSCVIKTMGPERQRYVPTSPVQVQISPSESFLSLKWSIPLSVEFQSKSQLPLPGADPEALPGFNPECTYEFQKRRKVATITYDGDAQDVEIANVRKKLYDQVIKRGFKPKLDETGRPQFFFLQNSVKACYTEEGLGMCVYEWRPTFSKSSEVGIELEFS